MTQTHFSGIRLLAAVLAAALAGCGGSEPPKNDLDASSNDGATDAATDGSIDAAEPECTSDDDCDGGNPCATHERCNTSAEVCEPVDALDEGAACGDGRVCEGGLCVLESTPECTGDEDCDDGNSCNGVDFCDLDSGTCQVRTCDDGDPCTENVCHTDGACTFELLDADGDGFAPAVSCLDPDLSGGDCDDTKAYVHPGAVEECDLHHAGRGAEVDNDCDGLDASHEESGLPDLYFRDRDGDGYGDEVLGVPCPLEGYVRGDTSASGHPNGGLIAERRDFDCFDGPDESSTGRNVHPGSTLYRTDPYCRAGTVSGDAATGWSCGGAGEEPSWDYDCDGDETQVSTEIQQVCICIDGERLCTGDGGSCTPPGWWGEVPECGRSGSWQLCSPVYDDQGRISYCDGATDLRVQRCR